MASSPWRIVILCLALAACKSVPQASTGAPAGAPSPRAAVDMFLTAVHAQDVQATADVWGTSKGPARKNMSRDQLEKRVLIMQCYLSHDQYTVTGDVRRANGHHLLHVQLQKGDTHAETDMETVEGPGDRWYVMAITDMDALQSLCRTSGTSGRRGR